MKKAKQLLEKLPEPYRTQALGYFNPAFYEDRLDGEPADVGSALTMAFDWDQTDEGYDYWHELYETL